MWCVPRAHLILHGRDRDDKLLIRDRLVAGGAQHRPVLEVELELEYLFELEGKGHRADKEAILAEDIDFERHIAFRDIFEQHFLDA